MNEGNCRSTIHWWWQTPQHSNIVFGAKSCTFGTEPTGSCSWSGAKFQLVCSELSYVNWNNGANVELPPGNPASEGVLYFSKPIFNCALAHLWCSANTLRVGIWRIRIRASVVFGADNGFYLCSCEVCCCNHSSLVSYPLNKWTNSELTLHLDFHSLIQMDSVAHSQTAEALSTPLRLWADLSSVCLLLLS